MQDIIVEREQLYKTRLVDALMNAGVAVNDMLNLRSDNSGYELLSEYPLQMKLIAKKIRIEGYDNTRNQIIRAFDKGDFSLLNFDDLKEYTVVANNESHDIYLRSNKLDDAYEYAYRRSLSQKEDIMILFGVEKENYFLSLRERDGKNIKYQKDFELSREGIPAEPLVILRNGKVKFGDENAWDIWYDGTPEKIMPQIKYYSDWYERTHLYKEKYPYIVSGISKAGESYLDRCDTVEKAVELFTRCHDQYSGDTYISYAIENVKNPVLLLAVNADNQIKNFAENIGDEQLANIVNDISAELSKNDEPVEQEEQEIKHTPQIEQNEEINRNIGDNDENKNVTHEENDEGLIDENAEAISLSVADEICSLLYGSEVTAEQYEDVADCILYFDGSTEGDRMLVEDLRKLQAEYSDHKISFEYMKSEELIGYLLAKAPQLDITQNAVTQNINIIRKESKR